MDGLNTKKNPSQLEKELRQMIRYPQGFFHSKNGGAVVVSFEVDDRQRIQKVLVHAKNKPLCAHIQKCLLQRRLKSLKEVTRKSFMVKVKFVPQDVDG
ncbi:MAG: hypothetical protein AAFU64_05845 [Bacteroidota bacterium]